MGKEVSLLPPKMMALENLRTAAVEEGIKTLLAYYTHGWKDMFSIPGLEYSQKIVGMKKRIHHRLRIPTGKGWTEGNPDAIFKFCANWGNGIDTRPTKFSGFGGQVSGYPNTDRVSNWECFSISRIMLKKPEDYLDNLADSLRVYCEGEMLNWAGNDTDLDEYIVLLCNNCRKSHPAAPLPR